MEPIFLLLVLVILAVAFTIASYIFKKGMLAFTSAGAWILASIHCFSQAILTWDIYFCLGFLFIGLTVACFFSPLAWRETTVGNDPTEEPDIRDLREEIEAFNRERGQYDFLRGNNKRSRRRSRW